MPATVLAKWNQAAIVNHPPQKKVNQLKKKKKKRERRKILWTEAIPEREEVKIQVNSLWKS